MTESFKLDNGITVLCEQRPGTGKVSMVIGFVSGSGHDDIAQGGLRNLMQHSTVGGTATRSRDQIAEDMEQLGAGYGFEMDQEETTFAAEALTESKESVFEILSDIVRNPSFDANEVRKTQQQTGQAIDAKDQNPGNTAREKYFEACFSGQAAGNSFLGEKELLASYTPQQVKDMHAQMLACPEDITISFAGDITPEEAKDLVQTHFGDLTQAPATQKTKVEFVGDDIRIDTNHDQMNIWFGFEAPEYGSRDRMTTVMLQELFAGGMSSPLFTEIREKRSLVYGVSAVYEAFENTGMFSIVAGTGKGNVGELIEVSMDLLGDVARDGFTDEEIESARKKIVRSVQGAQERSMKSAGRNLKQSQLLGRTTTLEELKAQLEQVSNDDIRRMAATMLASGKYALAGVGPQETMPSEQEITAMMAKQVEGLEIPEPSPVNLSAEFTAAASNTQNAAEPIMRSTTLPNGMMVVTTQKPGNLSCGAWVGAGAGHETEELNGATHMNEHMMFRGTPSHPAGTIPAFAENELGGGLNAYTGKDMTAYYFYDLAAENLEQVVNLCGEMVFEANIAEEEYGQAYTKEDGTLASTGERGVVFEEIKQYNDNVGARMRYLADRLAFPDQAYGRTILGTAKSLTGISAEMLRNYRDEYYAPNNVVFAASGPVDHEEFVALIESKYGHLEPSGFPQMPVPEYVGGTAHIEMESANICNLKIMAQSTAETDAESGVYDLFAAMLGGGGSSRLTKELVNRQELVPGISAFNFSQTNTGVFNVGTIVPAEKTKDVIREIYRQIHELANNPTQQELDKVKAGVEMGLIASLETNNDTCDAMGRDTIIHRRQRTPDELRDLLNAITLDDIKRVGKAILESNPSVAMVVPEGTDPSLIPDHDEVLALKEDAGRSGPQNTLAPSPQV